jgi:GNAT superfamily N-acetyltransferase
MTDAPVKQGLRPTATEGMMVIREATEMDALDVAMIHARSWRSAYRGLLSDQYLEHDVDADRIKLWQQRFTELTREDFNVFIAEDAGRAVGFACVFLEKSSLTALLDNLHVVPEKQGCGIGRRLMATAAEWVAEREPDAPLYLWVFEKNVAARRFYRKLGAIEAGIEEHEAPDGFRLPAVRCEWATPHTLRRNLQAPHAPTPPSERGYDVDSLGDS